MPDNSSFLGTGWSFPPAFAPNGGDVEMVSDLEDIRQSLEILFGTRLGERIMQEGYGSSLSDYQFEEISSAVLNRMRHMINDAVLYHEPRVKLNSVAIDRHQEVEGLLLIKLDISIPSSNSRYNLVYPFYLEEYSR